MDNNQYGYNYTPPQPPPPGKNKATASLIFGIVSLVFCWLGWATWGVGSIIALGLGIVGIVFAVGAKKELPPGQSGVATAGLACSIVGVCLSAIFAVCSIATYAAVGCAVCNALGSYNYYY